jgi:hypothetical protein
MTSGFQRTSAAARAGSRSDRPSVERCSTPSSRSPWGSAPQSRAPSVSLSGTFPRIPIRYTLPACCASTTSGAARRPPVVAAMKARRGISDGPIESV